MIKVSELFYSIQGEGLHVGAPSIFLRTFGCNFTCKQFGIETPYEGPNQEIIEALKKQYTDFKELPLVSTGCDSYGAWHPSLKHLSPLLEIPVIAERIYNLRPHNEKVHLVITGGEPLLGWQKQYPNLLSHPLVKESISHITFETNGTQLLSPELESYIETYNYPFTFAVSPKLSTSGEKEEDAIKPNVISQLVDLQYITGSSVFLKFVVSKDTDIDEIRSAVLKYKNVGFKGKVYLMPVGGVQSLYNFNAKDVAKMALDNGWYYSPRLQVDLFKNEWGT